MAATGRTARDPRDTAPLDLDLVITSRVALARAGLAALVARVPHVSHVRAVSPSELESALAGRQADAVILALMLEPQSGGILLEVATTVRRAVDAPALVVLAPYRNGYARDLVAVGPPRFAYVGEHHVPDAETLVRITRDVTNGLVTMDHHAVSGALGLSADRRQELLTPREHEVLAQLAEGKSNRAIAAHLSISVKSVEANVSAIFRKLDLEDDGLQDRRVRAARIYAG